MTKAGYDGATAVLDQDVGRVKSAMDQAILA